MEEEDCQVRIEKSSEIECSKCIYMDMNISVKFSVIYNKLPRDISGINLIIYFGQK